MNNKMISLLMMTFIFSACTANTNVVSDNELKAPSASSIQAQREVLYAKKLKTLRGKNATQEANRAIRSGAPYIMAYYGGRSNRVLTPSVSETQQRSMTGKCQMRLTDGFGDVIYGDHHKQYRQALRSYMTTFNRVTLSACLRK